MTTVLSESQILQPPAGVTPTSDRVTRFVNRWQIPPNLFVLVSGLLLGSSVGLAMVLFHAAIAAIGHLTLEAMMNRLLPWGFWTIAICPILGGAIVGLIRWRYRDVFSDPPAIRSPVIQPISPLRPFIKMLAAAISLGSGTSLGPEGPSVEIGANFGVALGQWFQVSKQRYRVLLGGGAAAGLAAGFNAPIAGVFFALEVVLGTSFASSAVSLVLLCAVVSSGIARIALGGHPAFDLPIYQVRSYWEYFFYLGLGTVAAFVSIAYTQAVRIAEDCFTGQRRGFGWLRSLPRSWHPAIGGACVGLAALQFPQILGIGYGTLEILLNNSHFSPPFLILLLVVKLAIAAICIGSGLVGGIFAPAMFIGAILGTVYGQILHVLIPAQLIEIAPPAAYATIGMAAVLAGSAKAPLTAILLMFELTQNYLIILPLMLAVGICTWAMEAFAATRPLPRLQLPQMGIHVEGQEEKSLLYDIAIASVMDRSYFTLSVDLSLLDAAFALLERRTHTALVVDDRDRLVGIVTLSDIQRAILQRQSAESSTDNGSSDDRPPETLAEICTNEIVCAYPQESADRALERMAIRGLLQLPVVSPDNPRQILGVIDRQQLTLASDLAATRAIVRAYFNSANSESSSSPEVDKSQLQNIS